MNFLYGNVLVCVMFLYKLFVVFLLLKRILNYGLLSLLFKVFSLFIKLKDGYNVIFDFVGELKILSSEFNNLWFNVFFDNKNIISNLYGNII